MLRRVAVATALVAAVATSPAAGAEAVTPKAAAPRAATAVAGTVVASWDAVGTQAFTAAALAPAEGHVILAYVSIAVYDAVVAIHGGSEPFAVRASAPRDTSSDAAVAAAAHDVLAHYLPAQAPGVVDPAYVTALAAIPDGAPKTRGVALGRRVAAGLVAQRADDGFRAPVTYTPPDPPVPGRWIPTAATPPVGTYLGGMRPFTLRSSGQFRPAGPPALGSRRWARDYAEVQAIGSATSTTRTEAQTTAARFWAEAPVQQSHGAFRAFIADHHLDVTGAARFMAMMTVTYADGFIACFEAKYHYAFWRPVTAIRAGDTDGNPATVADPSWTPLLATPNHPDYPSAHSCITPATGIVISRFLGTSRIDYTIPSLTGLGDRHYATAADLAAEVEEARIWGGIHYRSAVEDGAAIARRTAGWVLAHHFRPRPCR
jgi:hypothetical protein